MSAKRHTESKKTMTRQPGVANTSPIVQVRTVTRLNQILLFTRAGGRCEFDGCNKDVLKHHVTLQAGVFAQMAHIVAFKCGGPRGGEDGTRPEDVNDVRNLMLLCPACHKLIDDRPGDFSRKTLQEYKKRHEGRIRYVTGLGPDRHTAVIIVKSRIGGQVVQVPYSQVVEATAPRYPSSFEPTEIDLTGISDIGPGFIEASKHEIFERMRRFFESGGEGNKAQHLSIFALAAIPLLIYFGAQLSNKVSADFFQRHRDTEDWTWKKRGTPVRYLVRRLKTGKRTKVALLLSLSGTIPLKAIPKSVRDSSTIYEITLRDTSPATTFLRLRQDLDNFRTAYQVALGTILKNHGLIGSIDVFPAVPAPIAVLCGRELLPKVHPRLRVYDYNKLNGGFLFALEV
jgi:hypothetical protein